MLRRAGIRAVKVLLFSGGAGLLVEGALEVPRLRRAVLQPPSVPGESKILEHVAVQHIAFPALIGALVFRPASVRGLLQPPLVRCGLAALTLVLAVPETVVSAQGDLFRRYPFHLPAALRRFELVRIGDRELNVLQAHHLLTATWTLAATMAALAARPDLLVVFVGPRTRAGWPS